MPDDISDRQNDISRGMDVYNSICTIYNNKEEIHPANKVISASENANKENVNKHKNAAAPEAVAMASEKSGSSAPASQIVSSLISDKTIHVLSHANPKDLYKFENYVSRSGYLSLEMMDIDSGLVLIMWCQLDSYNNVYRIKYQNVQQCNNSFNTLIGMLSIYKRLLDTSNTNKDEVLTILSGLPVYVVPTSLFARKINHVLPVYFNLPSRQKDLIGDYYGVPTLYYIRVGLGNYSTTDADRTEVILRNCFVIYTHAGETKNMIEIIESMDIIRI